MYSRHRTHFFGLFSTPHVEWQSIREETSDLTQFSLKRLAFFAAIPAISFFFGLTYVGWSLSGSEFNKVPMDSALMMTVAFYAMIIIATFLMAYFTFITEKSIAEEASFERCLLFVCYTATPMFMAGLVGFLPIVWLCVLVLVAAVHYSLYLLYIGIPIYMDIPEGKSFMIVTSVLTAGLCMMLCFVIAVLIIMKNLMV
jgi:hypothetical protein